MSSRMPWPVGTPCSISSTWAALLRSKRNPMHNRTITEP
jgi:hypothetical protein